MKRDLQYQVKSPTRISRPKSNKVWYQSALHCAISVKSLEGCEMLTPDRVISADCDRRDKTSYSADEFPAAIKAIAEQHRPSRMPFFKNLASLDHTIASDPSLLG
jgi:hypothetical protein